MSDALEPVDELKQFFKQLFCSHVYRENTGWFEYSKGNRETVYCYGLQKMCLKCGDSKFYPIGKGYMIINPEDLSILEAIVEKDGIMKDNFLKEVVEKRELLNKKERRLMTSAV